MCVPEAKQAMRAGPSGHSPGESAEARTISLGLVHHANQQIITNGYDNREGVNDAVGCFGSGTGYLRLLELHARYRIPLNLHLSGTLLEALLWYREDVLAALRALFDQGLLELVGSSYAQNIMRFFDFEHNFRQLNELLALYKDNLGIDPRAVKVFWPPERVWDTERLAPVVSDSTLLNGGYKYVLVDDRLLYPSGEGASPRCTYDRSPASRPTDFARYDILGAHGLSVLPIARDLRQSIAVRGAGGIEKVAELLRWLATADPEIDGHLIAIYADDMEKAAGIGAWDPEGLASYQAFLEWLTRTPGVHSVRLSDWASARPAAGPKPIGIGTFIEMCNHFGAGEGYENWYFDPQWDRYRSYCAWSEERVRAREAEGADAALIDLAWKQLFAANWETAWHTPSWGVHGSASSRGEPSPWIKAAASHSRHAAVTAEAGRWMSAKDGACHACLADLDDDGDPELVLKNDRLFAVFSPHCGGRLVFLFSVCGQRGSLVIGNPCDDWNWMEELNRYMEVPANHPGACSDIGFENDHYEATIKVAHAPQVEACLVNVCRESRAFGLTKLIRLTRQGDEVEIVYRLPGSLNDVTVECGFSPDYLNLLRHGRRSFREHADSGARGYSNDGIGVWLRLDGDKSVVLDGTGPREFGHGYAVRVRVSRTRSTLLIGAGPTRAQSDAGFSLEEIRSCTTWNPRSA
jgi:starch synthase